jgi:DNA-binding NtrC family response regulator
LVESILFGHERGAFTGATDRHLGKFVEASGGTLFLDEVGELPSAAQVKLLRAIQEGEVEPIGTKKPVKVDVRLISATNRNLIADVKSGRFREDLFYRLHVFPVAVPPLRERAEDIPDLVRHFLARFGAEEGKRIRLMSAEALAVLSAYRWPGNVRQLENAIFRAVVLADSDEIGVTEFPQIAAQVSGQLAAPAGETAQPPASGQDLLTAMPLVVEDASATALAGISILHELAARADILPLLDTTGEVRALEDIEADAIRFAIDHYEGQMSEVARRLRIGRSTLYRKLEGLGLGADKPADAEAKVAAE